MKFNFSKDAPLYCMADGSMLLTREDKWEEVKLGRLFSTGSRVDGISKNRRMVTGSVYSAHFWKADEFWERFRQATSWYLSAMGQNGFGTILMTATPKAHRYWITSIAKNMYVIFQKSFLKEKMPETLSMG